MNVVRKIAAAYMRIPAGTRGPLQRLARLAAVAFAAYLVAHGLSTSPSSWVPAMGLTPAAAETAWRKLLAAPETSQLIAEEKARWDAWLVSQARAQAVSVQTALASSPEARAAAQSTPPNTPSG